MQEMIAIVGDGAMATTCALILTNKGHGVRLWGYDSGQIDEVRRDAENRRFLPGFKLPCSIQLTADDAEIFAGCGLAVSAVPCKFLRAIWTRLAGQIPSELPIVSVTKGIENDTLLRPSQIIEQVIGKHSLAVLSGPNIADELARSLPATSTVACPDADLAQRVQKIFSTNWLRVYTNSDLIGVELAAATKNVIAIAAGIIDGLQAGDNAKAALVTRGLVEISRLGVAMGAQASTFAGLSGMGDLITTCISPKGRNRTFGQAIGRGHSVEAALAAIPGEVEGVNTCRSVVALAARHSVEMPITHAVYEIIFEGKSVSDAIAGLMTRRLKAENSSGDAG